MSDFIDGEAYDNWKTTDPRDREGQVPVEDQPGYDPDLENDREYEDD